MELLKRDPAIDHVYPLSIVSTSDPQAGKSAYLRAGRQLLSTMSQLRGVFRQASYDMVFDLHGSFRSGLLGLTCPGSQRVGFAGAKELNPLFQHLTIRIPDHVEHALEINNCFSNVFNCEITEKDFYMCSSEADWQGVELFFEQHRIDPNRQVIYANPAARWQTKFWPSQRWAELADLFAARGLAMIFGGSEHDRKYIASITEQMKTVPLVAAGKFTLPQSVALIQHAALYVGLDSGPMHMAALSGIPAVALFGPTHPSRVGPYGVRHRIIRAEQLDCLECRKRRCSHLSCMKGITVEMVAEAALSLLGDSDRNEQL